MQTKQSIAFLQTNLTSHFESLSQNFRNDLIFSNFLRSTQSHIISKTDLNLPKFLNEFEKKQILEFVESLGKSDVKSQVEICQRAVDNFEEMNKVAKEKNLTQGSLYLKLFICIGLAGFLVAI